VSQYPYGRVRVESGSDQVEALWELNCPQAQAVMPAGARVEFAPSGASGIVVEHSPGRATLVVDKDAGADIASGDVVTGPSRPIVKSGRVASGTSLSLTAIVSDWVDDVYNGLWVARAPSAGGTEYRKITDTLNGNRVNVSPAWSSTPQTGENFIIYSEVSSPVIFQRGTPQDWTAPGFDTATDLFVFEDNPVFFGISSVAARALTLAANYTDPRLSAGEHLYGRYTVHRGFTLNRDYPYIEPGDTQLPSVFKRFAEMVDVDVDTLFASAGVPGGIQAVNLNGPTWTTVVGKGIPEYRKWGQFVMGQGVCVAGTTPSPGTNIGTIAGVDAPDVLLQFSSYGTRFEIDPSGNVIYQGPSGQSNFEMSLQFVYFLGGS
jgi:hypothetical protein